MHIPLPNHTKGLIAATLSQSLHCAINSMWTLFKYLSLGLCTNITIELEEDQAPQALSLNDEGSQKPWTINNSC